MFDFIIFAPRDFFNGIKFNFFNIFLMGKKQKIRNEISLSRYAKIYGMFNDELNIRDITSDSYQEKFRFLKVDIIRKHATSPSHSSG